MLVTITQHHAVAIHGPNRGLSERDQVPEIFVRKRKDHVENDLPIEDETRPRSIIKAGYHASSRTSTRWHAGTWKKLLVLTRQRRQLSLSLIAHRTPPSLKQLFSRNRQRLPSGAVTSLPKLTVKSQTAPAKLASAGCGQD